MRIKTVNDDLDVALAVGPRFASGMTTAISHRARGDAPVDGEACYDD
jgi:hypothetical protein